MSDNPTATDVIAFLSGRGKLDGVSFGGLPEGEPHYFWWRKYLPLLAPLQVPAQSGEVRRRTDALATAFALLDSFAGDGLAHVYGNGQTLDASDVCVELAAAFGMEAEPGWERRVAALLAPGNAEDLREVVAQIIESLGRPTCSATLQVPASDAGDLNLEALARAIHHGRFNGPVTTLWEDEDENGKTYCLRIANAVQLHLLSGLALFPSINGRRDHIGDANKLVEALRLVSAIRPTNWDDDDDADQVAAWRAVDVALAAIRKLSPGDRVPPTALHVAGNGQVLTMADVEAVIERLEDDPIDEDARDDAVRLIRFLAEVCGRFQRVPA